jgi:hypothetical protein
MVTETKEIVGSSALSSPPPELSWSEERVLGVLSLADRCLSLGQVQARTGIDRAELKGILEDLRVRGLAARLNTVLESYASRSPEPQA